MVHSSHLFLFSLSASTTLENLSPRDFFTQTPQSAQKDRISRTVIVVFIVCVVAFNQNLSYLQQEMHLVLTF